MTTRIRKTRTLPYRPESLKEVESLLNEVVPSVSLPDDRRDLMVRAIIETVDSMIEYSTYKGYDNDFSITLDVDEARFRAVIVDSMNIFDHTGDLSEPDLEREKAYEIRTDLLHEIMDEINYTYKRGSQNELECVNFLSIPQPS